MNMMNMNVQQNVTVWLWIELGNPFLFDFGPTSFRRLASRQDNSEMNIWCNPMQSVMGT